MMIGTEVHCARCRLVIWGRVWTYDTPADATHETTDDCIKALGERLRELDERLADHWHPSGEA